MKNRYSWKMLDRKKNEPAWVYVYAETEAEARTIAMNMIKAAPEMLAHDRNRPLSPPDAVDCDVPCDYFSGPAMGGFSWFDLGEEIPKGTVVHYDPSSGVYATSPMAKALPWWRRLGPALRALVLRQARNPNS